MNSRLTPRGRIILHSAYRRFHLRLLVFGLYEANGMVVAARRAPRGRVAPTALDPVAGASYNRAFIA